MLLKKYPCPVHCRYFCEDADMVLTSDKKEYVCLSLFHDRERNCDFSFPAGLSKKKIDALAEKRIRELNKMKLSLI